MIHPFNDYDQYIYTTAKTFLDETQLNPIPTNVIINKVITGWGATYAEIKAKRHSIILLPHKSQIDNKVKKHIQEDYVQAVNETISTEALKRFIIGRNKKHLKFLSTPEGLGKVITALKQCEIDAYNEVFLLLDESHKITKDIVYRVNISSFTNFFFKFENKAMISATPFKPSDPRLDEQGFEMWKVIHDRDVKKKIRLVCVNNIGAAFKGYLDTYDGEMLFVFFNSLNGIKALIDKNSLGNSCNIYCSEDGVKDFALKGMNNAYSTIDSNKLAKINFLTSSFYNGLDIADFEQMPDVLLLTDLRFADHTILDPYTDVYQILGRFRQPLNSQEASDRYRTATHIVNTKNSAVVKLDRETYEDFLISKKKYEILTQLQATTTSEWLRDDVYGEAKARQSPYSNLINTQEELEHFKFDNYLYEWRLKQCYGHPIALPLSYEFSDLFDVLEERKIFLPEEFVSMSKNMNRYTKDNIMLCCQTIIGNHFQTDEELKIATYKEVKSRFPMVARAHKLLGMSRIKELGFRKTAIEKALLMYDIKNGLNHHGLIDAIVKLFKIGISYSVAEVKSKIQKVYDEFKIKKTAKSTDISIYFTIREFTDHKEQPSKVLKERKHKDSTNLQVSEKVNESRKKSIRMYQITARKLNPSKVNSTREKPMISLED